eukprot:CFRG8206T1
MNNAMDDAPDDLYDDDIYDDLYNAPRPSVSEPEVTSEQNSASTRAAAEQTQLSSSNGTAKKEITPTASQFEKDVENDLAVQRTGLDKYVFGPHYRLTPKQMRTSPERRPNTSKMYSVYVQGTRWHTTDQELEDAFKSLNVHDLVQLRFIEDKGTGKCLSAVVCDFETVESAQVIMENLANCTFPGVIDPVTCTQLSSDQANQLIAMSKRSTTSNKGSGRGGGGGGNWQPRAPYPPRGRGRGRGDDRSARGGYRPQFRGPRPDMWEEGGYGGNDGCHGGGGPPMRPPRGRGQWGPPRGPPRPNNWDPYYNSGPPPGRGVHAYDDYGGEEYQPMPMESGGRGGGDPYGDENMNYRGGPPPRHRIKDEGPYQEDMPYQDDRREPVMRRDSRGGGGSDDRPERDGSQSHHRSMPRERESYNPSREPNEGSSRRRSRSRSRSTSKDKRSRYSRR